MEGDAGEPYGLCWGQQWSWHEQQVPASRRNPGLLLGDVLDLPDGSGRAGVRSALHLLLSRHASMRTTFFHSVAGAARQRVWPVDEGLYELDDFSDPARCREWLHRPLDLLAVWPLRVAVLHTGAGRARLSITVHHVAADRYGLQVLGEELRHVVAALARRAAPSLPPAGRQPADLAAFERSPAGQAVNEAALAYWMEQDRQLGEVLDSLRGRSDAPGGVMHVARVVSESGRRRLAELAEAAGSSEPTVAVAAVACVLAGHLGRATFPMTMSVSNRHLPGLERSVCSVAETGLIRARVPDPRDLRAAIPETWSGIVGAIQHAYYDGDQLSERMTAFDSGGLHTTAAPPNVNVVRVADSDPEPPAGRAGDEPWTSWVGQVEQRCVSLYFHARISESHLTIELRAGGHLVSAEESLVLVARAMRLLHE